MSGSRCGPGLDTRGSDWAALAEPKHVGCFCRSDEPWLLTEADGLASKDEGRKITVVISEHSRGDIVVVEITS